MALTIGPGMTINAGVTLNGGPAASENPVTWTSPTDFPGYGSGPMGSGCVLTGTGSTTGRINIKLTDPTKIGIWQALPAGTQVTVSGTGVIPSPATLDLTGVSGQDGDFYYQEFNTPGVIYQDQISSIGSVSFTPESGGGGGGVTPIITGTAEILFVDGPNAYGAAKNNAGGFGTLTSTPDTVQFFQYSTFASLTYIIFIQGTAGSVTVTDSAINGQTSVSVTYNGVTETSSGGPVDMGGIYLRFQFTGDPFSIVAAEGTTLPFSVALA